MKVQNAGAWWIREIQQPLLLEKIIHASIPRSRISDSVHSRTTNWIEIVGTFFINDGASPAMSASGPSLATTYVFSNLYSNFWLIFGKL